MTAMIAASLAQSAGFSHAIYPSLTGLKSVLSGRAGLIWVFLPASSTAV